MMKIKILALALLTTLGSFSANAEDNKPTTYEFVVDGVHVILRESVKGTVSARLFVRGGTANYEKESEGIENIALNLVMQSGPDGMSKDEFNSASEKVGAAFGANSGYDYGNISLNCVRMYWDESWDLFSQAIVTPAFRQADFDIFKEQMVTNAKQQVSNPDAYLNRMNMSKAWAGSNYEKFPSGSEESLSALTLQGVEEHYTKVITKKNIFLVVVGSITKEDLIEKIKVSLGNLPVGEDPSPMYSEERIQEGLYVEDRDIETNYIKGMFSAPQKGTEASIHNSLALSILGDRFFEELRTKRSLSYAPSAHSNGFAGRPTNDIYISTTDPKASLEVMIEEVNKVKTDGYSESELDGKKQAYLTGYYMGQQTNSSISMSLGINEMTGGWENADSFTEKVLKTNVKDLNKVVQEYGDKIYWTYLGKEELVKPEYFQQPVQTEKLKK